MLADYRAALAYAESLAEDCAQGMSVVAHNATIRESQKAIAEARGVTRLSRLATLFVPMALVTSVFNMNVREINAGDGPPIWAWAVVSLVAGCASWLWMRYSVSGAVARSWRFCRDMAIARSTRRKAAVMVTAVGGPDRMPSAGAEVERKRALPTAGSEFSV